MGMGNEENKGERGKKGEKGKEMKAGEPGGTWGIGRRRVTRGTG